MTFTFTPAASVPLAAIVRAINLVYPDGHDTVEGYAAQTTAGSIDLARSVVALDEHGEVAGIAMLGVRGTRGWCGDAAVVPQYQNQKLGQELMRRLSNSARAAGLRTLQLETRDDNAPARRVYEKEGYAYTRRMPCYAASLDGRGQAPSLQGWLDAPLRHGITITRAPDEATMHAALLRWYDTRFAPPPCWERELPSLLAYRRQSAWTATRPEGFLKPFGSAEREIAFLLCDAAQDGKMLHVHHLALTADATPDDVRALCATALRDTGIETLRIGLEPMDSRVAVMFREFGFTLVKDLWEMVKVL
ncbi:MAG: GNAT family N-acetyltransferase [Chloroflexota bacterium]